MHIDFSKTSNDSLWKEIADLLERVSTAYTLAFDFIGGSPMTFKSTFPDEWKLEYQTNFYMMSDPAVLWGLQNDGVKNWNELSLIFPDMEVDLISLARARGFKNGSVISFTFNRQKVIIGIIHEKTDLPPGTAQELTALVCAYVSNIEVRESPRLRDLTQKQREVLRLASQGRTTAEIATAINSQPRSVRNIEKLICQNLGASTMAQAVLIGWKSRIF